VTTSVTAKLRSRTTGWPAARRSAGWSAALRYSLGVFAVTRVALFALSAAAWGLAAEQPSVTPAGTYPRLTSGWHNIITGWNKQDSNWFQLIAGHGYSVKNASASFYPGYPLAIRLVSYVTGGHDLLAGYLVTSAALIAAMAILVRLTELEFGPEFARRSVLYLALMPTAFFLFDTYSEALFLLAAAGAFYLARTRRWGWAGLAGIAATATRSLGVVIIAALAAEAIHQAVEEHRGQAAVPRASRRLRLTARTAVRLAAAALPLAGIGGYLLFWQLRYGDWFRPFSLEQTMWFHQLNWPWLTLWQGLVAAWHSGQAGNGGLPTFDFVIVAAGLVLAVWVGFRARPVYAVYTWVSIALFLSQTVPGRPLVSDPRYLVTIFPLVWPLAFLGRRQHAHSAVIAVSSASMAIVAWLFLLGTGIY
jgi:hypothetical protein